jgi:uncharacterized membrane protein YoaK (UPF0700 family)
MDAIAFLALGDVFTSAMSGNTILFGIALGQGRLSAASHSLVAFLGYVCGVAGAALSLRDPAAGLGRTLAVEVLVLAAFAAYWTARGGPVESFDIYVLIALSAVAMGLQGAIGRTIGRPGIPTIVITSTLTAIIGTVCERILRREGPTPVTPTMPQVVSFIVYLASAVLTGWAIGRWRAAVPFLPLAAVLMLVTGRRLRMLRL